MQKARLVTLISWVDAEQADSSSSNNVHLPVSQHSHTSNNLFYSIPRYSSLMGGILQFTVRLYKTLDIYDCNNSSAITYILKSFETWSAGITVKYWHHYLTF